MNEAITLDGVQWIKGYLYYDKPYLNKEELMKEYSGGTYLEGYMKLEEIENGNHINFIYSTVEELIKAESYV